MVRAVTLDWWYTLAVPPTPNFDKTLKAERVKRIQEALNRSGYPLDQSRIEAAYDAQGTRFEEVWATRRDLNPEAQLDLLLQGLGLDHRDDLREVLEAPYSRVILDLMPQVTSGAPEAIRGLWDGGLSIGLISNTGRSWGRVLRVVMDRLGIGQYFRHMSFSDEVGYRKPQPHVFLHCLQGLGLQPREVVHMGDDLEADIGGAHDVGMKALWFSGGSPEPHGPGGADGIVRSFRELPEVLGALR